MRIAYSEFQNVTTSSHDDCVREGQRTLLKMRKTEDRMHAGILGTVCSVCQHGVHPTGRTPSQGRFCGAVL